VKIEYDHREFCGLSNGGIFVGNGWRMSWLWFRVYLALDDRTRDALREALYAAADPRAPGYGAYRCVCEGDGGVFCGLSNGGIFVGNGWRMSLLRLVILILWMLADIVDPANHKKILLYRSSFFE
jgi:hypothetical protein